MTRILLRKLNIVFIVTINFFLVFLSQRALGNPSSANLYKCYAQINYDICIPSLQNGSKILAVIENESFFNSMDAELRLNLPNTILQGTAILLSNAPENKLGKGELQLLSDNPNKKVYDVSSYFPLFIASKLNKGAGYLGPNCYNTALIVSGLLENSEPFYSSINELEFYLKYFYTEIFPESYASSTKLQFGDIILYDAKSSKLHASVYLFNGLIFHKKGYQTGYNYRIVSVKDPFNHDPFEWQPNPEWGVYVPPMQKNSINKPQRYFRIKNGSDATFNNGILINKKEESAVKIIDFLRVNALSSLKKSEVGNTLGYITETLSSSLQTEFSFLQSSNNPKLQLAYLKLKAVSEQIFQAIEVEHFSSPYAYPAGVLKEICWHNNQYTRELSRLLFAYVEKDYSEEKLTDFIESLSKVNRKECNLNLLKLVQEF